MTSRDVNACCGDDGVGCADALWLRDLDGNIVNLSEPIHALESVGPVRLTRGDSLL